MRWTHDAQVIPAIGSSISTVVARAAAPPLDGSVGMAACILLGSIPARKRPDTPRARLGSVDVAAQMELRSRLTLDPLGELGGMSGELLHLRVGRMQIGLARLEARQAFCVGSDRVLGGLEVLDERRRLPRSTFGFSSVLV